MTKERKTTLGLKLLPQSSPTPTTLGAPVLASSDFELEHLLSPFPYTPGIADQGSSMK